MELEYRSSVIAVFTNDRSEVLVGERGDHAGAYQLPQGGIEPGESAVNALFREMEEELGCSAFSIVASATNPIRYRFPPELTTKIARKYCGQSQQWFLTKFHEGSGPDLAKADKEFRAFAWWPAQRVVDEIVDWKRAAYREGFKALGFDLKPS